MLVALKPPYPITQKALTVSLFYLATGTPSSRSKQAPMIFVLGAEPLANGR